MAENQNICDEESIATAEAWKVFGGDTEAGRLLRKLYGKDEKPVIHYPKIKTRSSKVNAAFIPTGSSVNDARTRVSAVKNSARAVRVPVFKAPTLSFSLDTHKGRKPIKEIQREMEDLKRDLAIYRGSHVGLSNAEKSDKLQRAFTYAKGTILPQALLPDAALLDREKRYEKRSNQSKSRLQQLEDIYDELLTEVESKRQYIRDMIELDQHSRVQAMEIELLSSLQEVQALNDLIRRERSA